ncbi:MAG: glycoside hydrolase family 97 C-terminal domain-containing protein, partial [Croceitalea sp.]|nr:glycoside hydrolase family 97 C-terminal domain-containing protein [Croceitalea sp.]
NTRDITIDFEFLEDGKTYEAVMYKDAENSHFRENPTAIDIQQLEIKKGTTQTITFKEGGGFAISLKAKAD